MHCGAICIHDNRTRDRSNIPGVDIMRGGLTVPPYLGSLTKAQVGGSQVLKILQQQNERRSHRRKLPSNRPIL